MAHLTDLEELISSIISKDEAEYMREAMKCYMAGAYRGCIVLSYIALFDDLLEKLAELGKINSNARTIYKEAEKRKSDQQVFESYLISQLKSNNLLSGLDVTFIETLRTLRNKSAHPSGHKPSPEEARFIFYEVINRFLSKPILSTTQLVEDLLNRIKNTNFFPTNSISDIAAIVKDETKLLHHEAIPHLISLLAETVVSPEGDGNKNSGFFLSGLASLDDENINKLIIQKIISKKSDDEKYSNIIVRLITANGNLFNSCSDTVIKRLANIFGKRIETITASKNHTQFSHPIAFFNSLLQHVAEERLISSFETQLKEMFEKFSYSNTMINSLDGHEEVKNIYFTIIKNRAGSSSFDIANEFARSLADVDDELAKILSVKQAFELILQVIKAAEWGAFGAKDLKNAKFNPAPKTKEKAKTYCDGHAKSAESRIDKTLSGNQSVEDFILQYLS